MRKKAKKIMTVLYILMLFFALFACHKDDGNQIGTPEKQYETQYPVNPHASPNTVALYNYLLKSYKNVVLSGQYVNTFENFTKDRFLKDTQNKTSWSAFKTDEMTVINQVTEDYPLILGLDAALLAQGRDQSTVDFAKEWHDAGGIVTMCWHWFSPGAHTSFYTKDTDFNLKRTLNNPQGEDYAALLADIDALCNALMPLAKADVPVLWRPLHEAAGGWFWWGDSGADCYRQLYRLLYQRMTEVHGLNNLIWMANAQNKNWYVGDSICDIISYDPYYLNESRFLFEMEPTNSYKYNQCYLTTQNKMIAMSENEFIPDINKMFEDGVYWSMFVTWCREYVCKVDENGFTLPEYGGIYATAVKELSTAYQNARVVTMNDKPLIYG